ncbi:FAD binding domain-containing protein [Dichotomocladium elegans]|nr:FAD binding domain-containing protein [Dichotomocladium elegans]
MSQKTIIIIGGGLAGLTATIESATTNPSARVILLDKEKGIGGNSAKATSGINGMTEQGDTFEDFEHDTLESGGGLSNIALVKKLVYESVDALAWLREQDPTLDLSLVSQCGGHSRPRTHRCAAKPGGGPVPVGWRLVQALKQKAGTLGNVEIRTESRVQRLIVAAGNDAIRGVELANGEKIDAEAVILASGGFGGQTLEIEQPDGMPTLLSQYAPHLLNIATTNGPWANGDGVRLGLAVGAATKDMDQIQIHPTGFVDPANPKAHTKFLAPEALRAYGGVLLSSTGHRFVNELTRRDALTKAILETQSVPINLVMTDAMIDSFGRSTAEFYAKKGFFKKCAGLQELATQLGANASIVEDEFKRYDMHVTERTDDATASIVPDRFGKTLFPKKLLEQPQTTYWVAQITPCIHYTMGGLEINTSAQVISEQTHQPIPGLFAAGEVTSGVHGKNRLAGNSLLECVVYGRTAGRNAAKYASA